MGEEEPHPFDPEAVKSPESRRSQELSGEFRSLAATVDESLAALAPFVEADNSEARRLQEALRIYQGDLDKFGPLEEQKDSFLERSIQRLRDSLAETAELIRKSTETKTEIETLLASPAVRRVVEEQKPEDENIIFEIRANQELIDDPKKLYHLRPDDILLRGSLKKIRDSLGVE